MSRFKNGIPIIDNAYVAVKGETLSGTKTLTISDYIAQWLDPGGADRTVTLPVEASSTNLLFIILNTADGAGEDLVVKNAAAATIATLGPGMSGIFSCDGTNWKWENDSGVFYDSISDGISIGYLNKNISCLTYDDSTLSGTPIIIRLQDIGGTYYYTKVYPTASATANATIDDIGLDVIGITDATLSGTPKVFEIKSNSGVSYYVKAYPTISAEVASSRGITLTPIIHSDTTLSGTPRVASVQIGGADYYTKAYPTKA